MWNDQLLMARRLVEAGARCVTVAYGFWDTHGQNFRHLKQHLPLFDQGISALVEDIYARGLDRDVTVVVWGEFGRTPKINKDAGRDHWAPVNCALLAGGGMKVGQVIGSTDSSAARAAGRPDPVPDVLATVYHNLGIDPHALVPDSRPPGPDPAGDRPADPGTDWLNRDHRSLHQTDNSREAGDGFSLAFQRTVSVRASRRVDHQGPV